MLNSSQSGELLDFLERYLAFYREFLALETKKCSDLSANSVDLLMEHLKKGETCMLRSKGMEIERERLMKRFGLPGLTFRQTIPQMDPTQRERAQALYGELSGVILELKEINRRSNTLAQLRLRHTEKKIRELNARAGKHAAAGRGAKPSSILSKKI